MNNLMLSFAGAELTRLRTLVAAVAKEVEQVATSAPPPEKDAPKTALETTWTRLVEMLDLGAEAEMRECPNCKHMGMLLATRCGHCWTVLPPRTEAKRSTA
jgi:hypothetical protein